MCVGIGVVALSVLIERHAIDLSSVMVRARSHCHEEGNDLSEEARRTITSLTKTAHHSSAILMEMSFRMMFFCVAVRAEEPTLAYFAQDLIPLQIGQ